MLPEIEPKIEPIDTDKIPKQLDTTPVMSSPEVDDLVDNPEYEDEASVVEEVHTRIFYLTYEETELGDGIRLQN